MQDSILVYSYQFNFPDKESIKLSIEIDSLTVTLQAKDEETPFWTALDFNQCSNCPLNIEKTPFCPVAQNLTPLLEVSNALVSYDEVNVIVTTPERIISSDTTLQRAISSLLGLVIATSPCPHTEFLLPMARFHLPLASAEETLWRACSNFLLAQYFKAEEGIPKEMLGDILRRYSNLEVINSANPDGKKRGIEVENVDAGVLNQIHINYYPQYS